jgi:predicted SAM-dependent methyltransferase
MTMYPNRLGLVIGVPCSGNPIVMDWAFAFHSLHPPMDYNVEYSIVKGKPVDEARNFIADYAISKEAKYLFFVDEDVTPPAHAIRQLIYHLEHHPKYAVAAGIYCHKSQPCMPMVFRGNGGGPYWDWKIGEVFDCSGVGMGCALIRVAALKDIEKPYFKTIDNVSAFMDGVNKGEAWTEDLYFTDKLTKAGWSIMADGGILPAHWDTKSGVAYNLPPTAKPLQRTKVEPGKKKVIDLGCGPHDVSYKTEEGTVLRVDIREDVFPDYRCDVRVLPFGTEEFDIVFSSHVLEHFCRNEVPKVLDEWIRILKPDGELRLVLPNLEWAAQHIMNKEIDADVMNVLYGAQSYDENFHKVGFVPQTVEQLLAERGFKKFIWDFHLYHMFVRAWKVEPYDVQPVNPIVRVPEQAPVDGTNDATTIVRDETPVGQP